LEVGRVGLHGTLRRALMGAACSAAVCAATLGLPCLVGASTEPVELLEILRRAAAVARVSDAVESASGNSCYPVRLEAEMLGSQWRASLYAQTEHGLVAMASYDSHGCARLSVSLPVEALADAAMGGAAGRLRQRAGQAAQLRQEAEAGARVLDLLAQAELLAEADGGTLAASLRAQAAAALGLPASTAGCFSVCADELDAVIHLVQAQPIDGIVREWVENDPDVLAAIIEMHCARSTAWLGAATRASVALDLAWPVGEPGPVAGVRLEIPLGLSGRAMQEAGVGRGLGDAELRLAAARAESEVELAKLLHQLENAGWAAGAEGTEPRSRAARLSAAAAALRILAGMGLGMEVRGGRLVAVQRISVPGV
jgi:hypothetical protein